jgi:glutaconate CoA-transferase subunit A
MDIAVAAKHTIISCDELVSNEEMRRHPEQNTLTGMCVDAVVHLPYGAHPTQCFGLYDYDSRFFIQYEQVSRKQQTFDAFIQEYVHDCPTHGEYLDKWGASSLLKLRVVEGYGYVPGLKRK